MGKITRVNHARKVWKCSKCGKEIAVGDPYIRGDINFSAPIIACTDCGLKPYEVTTSDWVRRIGCLVEDFSENYPCDSDGISMMVDELNEIRDELQDKLDNMPEGLQEGSVGETLQDRIDMCDDASSELENIDVDMILDDVIDDIVGEIVLDDVPEDMSCREIYESESILPKDVREELHEDISEELDSRVIDAISDALSSLEY